MNNMNLKPAVYSKAQFLADIIQKLLIYPRQVCNSPEAFKGLVIEFVMKDGPEYGQPVGSLPEFFEHTHNETFVIHTRFGGSVRVTKDSENWRISEVTPDNIAHYRVG
jgi:hypothetical protein